MWTGIAESVNISKLTIQLFHPTLDAAAQSNTSHSDKGGNSELISISLAKKPQTPKKLGKPRRGQGKVGAEVSTENTKL